MNSMTGFGSASQRDRRMDIDVEVRSVNHRFLTIKQSLPDPLGRVEGEGSKISDARHGHLQTIEGRLGKVQSRVPQVVEAYQKRLDDRIQQLLTQRGLEAVKIDIVKEVAIHADRCDTSEEIQRLKA